MSEILALKINKFRADFDCADDKGLTQFERRNSVYGNIVTDSEPLMGANSFCQMHKEFGI